MLRPAHWGIQLDRPVCRLVKALYGHPESGTHWEKHLTEAIERCGGAPVGNHPSSFWFPNTKLLLSVYVDDLLLSGPSKLHDKLWQDLPDKFI
eukprot:7580146-Karenia_brevis.AAC.1